MQSKGSVCGKSSKGSLMSWIRLFGLSIFFRFSPFFLPLLIFAFFSMPSISSSSFCILWQTKVWYLVNTDVLLKIKRGTWSELQAWQEGWRWSGGWKTSVVEQLSFLKSRYSLYCTDCTDCKTGRKTCCFTTSNRGCALLRLNIQIWHPFWKGHCKTVFSPIWISLNQIVSDLNQSFMARSRCC